MKEIFFAASPRDEGKLKINLAVKRSHQKKKEVQKVLPSYFLERCIFTMLGVAKSFHSSFSIVSTDAYVEG